MDEVLVFCLLRMSSEEKEPLLTSGDHTNYNYVPEKEKKEDKKEAWVYLRIKGLDWKRGGGGGGGWGGEATSVGNANYN